MSYEVACPNGHKLRVEAENFGKKARCARCGVVFAVPDLGMGGGDPAPGPEVELPESGGMAPPPPAFPPAPHSSPALPRPRAAAAGILGINMTVAQSMMLAGLVLVLVAKGCDSLGVRGVVRAGARVQAAQNDFNDRWELKLEKVRLDRKPTTRVPAFDGPTMKLQEDEANLRKEMAEERARLQRAEWRDLQLAVRDAGVNNQLMGYWRELLFILGTVILTIGLIAVGVQGEGAQRWICLTMVAIITFSLYIGGTAWVAGLLPGIGR